MWPRRPRLVGATLKAVVHSEYRVTIRQSDQGDWQLYGVAYVGFGEAGEVLEISPVELEDTDPGVVAGTLLGARAAFEKPPIDLRYQPPRVCSEVLKT